MFPFHRIIINNFYYSNKMDFFVELNLKIDLNWSLIENINLVNSLKNISTEKWNLSTSLLDSFEVEHAKYDNTILEKLLKLESNNIEQIHQILTK